MKLNKHPYQDLESLKAWNILDKAIKDLVANGDLDERTAWQYITGYLVEQLKNADLLTSDKNSNGIHFPSSVRGAAPRRFASSKKNIAESTPRR